MERSALSRGPGCAGRNPCRGSSWRRPRTSGDLCTETAGSLPQVANTPENERVSLSKFVKFGNCYTSIQGGEVDCAGVRGEGRKRLKVCNFCEMLQTRKVCNVCEMLPTESKIAACIICTSKNRADLDATQRSFTRFRDGELSRDSAGLPASPSVSLFQAHGERAKFANFDILLMLLIC